VAAFLAPLLAEEGVALHVRGGLVPLLASEAWIRSGPCSCSGWIPVRVRRTPRLQARRPAPLGGRIGSC
jgi:hypothetical protein